jgi:uncharacterized damage-inducible protein DinB
MDDANERQVVWPPGETALVTMFRHNLWANQALFDACAALDEAQLAATAIGTYGTIYDTLHHLVRAEQGYLYMLTGDSPVARMRREHKPDVATLRENTRLFGEGLMAVAAGVTPDMMAYSVEEDGQWAIPAGVVLTQVINHATEHRAHIMTILTQMGIQPPELDGWAFGDRYSTFTSNK